LGGVDASKSLVHDREIVIRKRVLVIPCDGLVELRLRCLETPLLERANTEVVERYRFDVSGVHAVVHPDEPLQPWLALHAREELIKQGLSFTVSTLHDEVPSPEELTPVVTLNAPR